MRVGNTKDDVPQVARPGFWSLGKISIVEVMAVVGILAILVGIVAGTIAA